MNHEPAQFATHPTPSNKGIRILIADDVPIWRKQIRKILNTRPEWEVIAEACDGEEALFKAVELRPDIVLLDIGMPVMNGIQAATRIRQLCPSSHIIFITQTNDEAVREAALDFGAVGYVLKVNAPAELVALIAAAQNNGAGH